MSKFKIGDKVVAASQKDSEVWLGQTGAFCEDDLSLIEPKAKRDYVADHARRTFRAAGVPKDVAAKLVRNLAGSKNYSLSKLSRKLPESASGIMLVGFFWGDSPEGLKFWDTEQRAQYQREQEATANA